MKLVLNDSFGGFGFSKQFKRYLKLQNLNPSDFYTMNVKVRSNQKLIESVEYFKNNNMDINYSYSSIVIFEIPDDYTDIKFYDYDGYESCIYVKDGKLYNNHNERIGDI